MRADERDDTALVRAAGTEIAAFGVLYDRYVERVFAYCARRLQTRAMAEDATSQIFLKAIAGLPGYQPEVTSFRTWLFTIARHVVVDCYRDRIADTSIDQALHLPADWLGPEEVVIAREADQELYALVDQLPPDQVHLIHLRLAGLTGPEIAQVLGRSHNAVRTAQHRAIQRLRDLSARHATTEGGER